MKWLMLKVTDFIKEEEGVTAIEYGLIAMLIAVFIIGAISATGGSLNTMFTSVSNDLDTVAGKL